MQWLFRPCQRFCSREPSQSKLEQLHSVATVFVCVAGEFSEDEVSPSRHTSTSIVQCLSTCCQSHSVPAYTVVTWQGGHRVGEKNSPSFPGFSRAIIVLFQRLSQHKVYVIMTFIYQGLFHIKSTTHVTNKSLSSHTAPINHFRAPDTLGCIWIA